MKRYNLLVYYLSYLSLLILFLYTHCCSSVIIFLLEDPSVKHSQVKYVSSIKIYFTSPPKQYKRVFISSLTCI